MKGISKLIFFRSVIVDDINDRLIDITWTLDRIKCLNDSESELIKKLNIKCLNKLNLILSYSLHIIMQIS